MAVVEPPSHNPLFQQQDGCTANTGIAEGGVGCKASPAVIAVPETFNDGKVKNIITNATTSGNSSSGEAAILPSTLRVTPALQQNKVAVLASCRVDGCTLQYASPLLRDDKGVVIVACRQTGLALRFASPQLQADSEVVLTALDCNNDPRVLRYASKDLLADAKFMVLATQRNRRAFQYASNRLKETTQFVLDVCSQDGLALELASKAFQSNVQIVSAACRQNGFALQFASPKLRANDEIVLIACHQNLDAFRFVSNILLANKRFMLEICGIDGLKLEFAAGALRGDKDVVLVACRQHGWALQFASTKFKEDKEVVVAACTTHWDAIRFASRLCHKNMEIVLAACNGDWRALQYAHKSVVLDICQQNGWMLQYASLDLRADKNVVIVAVTNNPASLKFARGGLHQDRDCLIAAKIWDETYDRLALDNKKPYPQPSGLHPLASMFSSLWKKNKSRASLQSTEDATTAARHSRSVSPVFSVDTRRFRNNNSDKAKIVLSTRFSLGLKSSPHATQFTVSLKQHPYVQNSNFIVYSPNAYQKDSCDPQWTRLEWPCRGTQGTCRMKQSSLRTGTPQLGSCWRYSFRYQLEEAKRLGGFMIQVVDLDEQCHHQRGKGQRIETEMAKEVGTKIFRSYEPTKIGTLAVQKEVDRLVLRIQQWFEAGCADMSECIVRDT